MIHFYLLAPEILSGKMLYDVYPKLQSSTEDYEILIKQCRFLDSKNGIDSLKYFAIRIAGYKQLENFLKKLSELSGCDYWDWLEDVPNPEFVKDGLEFSAIINEPNVHSLNGDTYSRKWMETSGEPCFIHYDVWNGNNVVVADFGRELHTLPNRGNMEKNQILCNIQKRIFDDATEMVQRISAFPLIVRKFEESPFGMQEFDPDIKTDM